MQQVARYEGDIAIFALYLHNPATPFLGAAQLSVARDYLLNRKHDMPKKKFKKNAIPVSRMNFTIGQLIHGKLDDV